jgi:hypothetical protein
MTPFQFRLLRRAALGVGLAMFVFYWALLQHDRPEVLGMAVGAGIFGFALPAVHAEGSGRTRRDDRRRGFEVLPPRDSARSQEE